MTCHELVRVGEANVSRNDNFPMIAQIETFLIKGFEHDFEQMKRNIKSF